jgi:hypothetical protein
MTLTTAGLGDLVPTSDGAKISCSIFIYFGVACIGLLLGSYIAGMLDESSSREAKANQIKSCPNCARIHNIKDAAAKRDKQGQGFAAERGTGSQHMNMSERRTEDSSQFEPNSKKAKRQKDDLGSPRSSFCQSERVPASYTRRTSTTSVSSDASPTPHHHNQAVGVEMGGVNQHFGRGYSPQSPVTPPHQILDQNLLGSPLTAQILGRQNHTRHSSFDLNSGKVFGSAATSRSRMFSMDLPTTYEESADAPERNHAPPPPPPQWHPEVSDDEAMDDHGSSDSEEASESDEEIDLEEKYSSVKNAKYVFLTLREALLNSLLIIAFGCLGFYYIEGFSIVDSK